MPYSTAVPYLDVSLLAVKLCVVPGDGALAVQFRLQLRQLASHYLEQALQHCVVSQSKSRVDPRHTGTLVPLSASRFLAPDSPPLLPVPFLSSVLLHGTTFPFLSDRTILWMHCVLFLSLLTAAGGREHIPPLTPTPPAQFIYTISLIPCGKLRLPYLGIRLQKRRENNFS